MQKAAEMRQLTARLADLNSRLGNELAEQSRLVADYDRLRDAARRALGVLHVVRDAEAVLAETKDQLLAVLAQRDVQQQQQQQQPHPSFPEVDDDDYDDGQMSAATVYDMLRLD